MKPTTNPKVTSGITHDDYGPEYVIEVYDPHVRMRGFLVIDNTILGPGKGGVRMTDEVTAVEVFRLARTMTWKNALAGIPFGGAKAGIIWPRNGTPEQKKAFVQSFARAVAPLLPQKYIAGPDVNTGAEEMRWFVEATGNPQTATGKPENLGGLPHELGSTGFGVAHATRVAAEIIGLNLNQATVAVEGFGNVGSFVTQFLQNWGARIVAVADSQTTAYLPEGLDYETLAGLKAKHQRVGDYPQAQKLTHNDIFGLDVDILIPAAVTDVINSTNQDAINAQLIVEGANIPMQQPIEDKLFTRGVTIVPDFIANAGGVISSYAEYQGLSSEAMFKLVKEKVVNATQAVVTQSLREKKSPRAVAVELARRKVAG